MASAPILLASLAVIATRADAPDTLITRSIFVAWLSGALAFFAALIDHRGGHRAARVLAVLSALVVGLWSLFVVWLSSELA